MRDRKEEIFMHKDFKDFRKNRYEKEEKEECEYRKEAVSVSYGVNNGIISFGSGNINTIIEQNGKRTIIEQETDDDFNR